MSKRFFSHSIFVFFGKCKWYFVGGRLDVWVFPRAGVGWINRSRFSRELVDRMMMTTVTMMMTTVTLVMTTMMIGTENTQEKFFLVRAGWWHGWKLFSIYNWFESAVLRKKEISHGARQNCINVSCNRLKAVPTAWKLKTISVLKSAQTGHRKNSQIIP